MGGVPPPIFLNPVSARRVFLAWRADSSFLSRSLKICLSLPFNLSIGAIYPMALLSRTGVCASQPLAEVRPWARRASPHDCNREIS